jgi:hypothetical protein
MSISKSHSLHYRKSLLVHDTDNKYGIFLCFKKLTATVPKCPKQTNQRSQRPCNDGNANCRANALPPRGINYASKTTAPRCCATRATSPDQPAAQRSARHRAAACRDHSKHRPSLRLRPECQPLQMCMTPLHDKRHSASIGRVQL